MLLKNLSNPIDNHILQFILRNYVVWMGGLWLIGILAAIYCAPHFQPGRTFREIPHTQYVAWVGGVSISLGALSALYLGVRLTILGLKSSPRAGVFCAAFACLAPLVVWLSSMEIIEFMTHWPNYSTATALPD